MTDATSPPTLGNAAPAAVELEHRTKLQILGAILLGLFLAALDQTVVGTALPRIVTDLGGNQLYTWSITIYLLTSTVSGPIWGKLSDLFGRRPVVITAIVLFLLGSALCGLSQEMWQLILFRGIQGLGGGALFPISLAVIGDLFTPAERGKYQGLFGAVFGLSALVGPALGGLLTDTVGWRSVFYVNVPLGGIALAIIWRTLPGLRREGGRPHVDYLGAAVFTAAIVPILVGLTNKQSADWTDPTVGGLLALGLALLAAFVWVESRAAEPIVPLELFRIRQFSLSVGAMFLAAFGFFSAAVFLPRWFQVVAGSSATEAGYQLLALLGGLIVSATTAGQIVARTGRYKLLMLASLALLALGLLLLTNLRADTPMPLLWLWMAIAGIGIGPSLAVFALIVQNSVPPKRLGAASSALAFFQATGGTVGLAIAGTIFGQALRAEAPRQMLAAGVPSPVVDRLVTSGADIDELAGVGDLGALILADVPADARPLVEPLVPSIVAGVEQAFSIATAGTFTLGIAGAIGAAVLVLAIREVPMRRGAWQEPGTESPAVAAVRADAPPARAGMERLGDAVPEPAAE